MSNAPRIKTTHVGSLPRPQAVVDQVWAEERGEPVDPEVFDRVVTDGVAQVVRLQRDNGIDVVSDGEMGKVGYATYIRHRLSGFGMAEASLPGAADLDAFPGFRDNRKVVRAAPQPSRPVCMGPIAYETLDPLKADLRRMTSALKGAGVAEGFMNAPSPGVITHFHPDMFYKDHEAYLYAAADAMKTEYQAIVGAGLYLQIDAPDLAMGRHSFYRNATDAQFVDAVRLHVAALNHALGDLPAERVRMHLCWGNYEGPHHLDIGLAKIVAEVLKAKPAILLFEGANPRHSHEWVVWRDIEVPANKVLVPGVISSTSNYIEHPDLIAERLGRFVDIVGADRVMAGSDCGFGTWAGHGAVDPDVCWAKFRAMAEGAKMALQ